MGNRQGAARLRGDGLALIWIASFGALFYWLGGVASPFRRKAGRMNGFCAKKGNAHG